MDRARCMICVSEEHKKCSSSAIELSDGKGCMDGVHLGDGMLA